MASEFVPTEPKKSNMPIIIGVAVAVVLCCCCILFVLFVPAVMGPSIGNVFSKVNEELTTPQAEPAIPSESQRPTKAPADDSGSPVDTTGIPVGGLGNEILRGDVWVYVQLASAAVSCEPVGADSVFITVTQEYDSTTQTWAETWSVACASGETKDFDVSYQQDETGVKFNVRTQP